MYVLFKIYDFLHQTCVVYFLLFTPPGKTREVKFTRVFFYPRDFSRVAMFVTSLMKQGCYGLNLTSLLQHCSNKLAPSQLTSLLQHRHDRIATSPSTSCYKSVTTSLGQPVRAHLVNKLLVQTCYKSAAGLLQVVRFYACSTHVKISQLVNKMCSQQACSKLANKL